jgi:hypothetical protein
MTSNGIDVGYLQTELANFCNEKLVGGSLIPTLPSVESSASSVVVADAISNPLNALQEKALEWLDIGTAAISQSLLEFSSSVQPTVISDLAASLDPNLLVPSLIMFASMTITVAMPSKPVSPVEEMPKVNKVSFPLEPAIQTAGTAMVTPLKQPSYDMPIAAVSAASTIIAPSETASTAVELRVAAADAGVVIAASSSESSAATEDFAIENHAEVLQGATTTIVSTETPLPLKRATTVMTKNSRTAVAMEEKASKLKKQQQQQLQTATNILDSLILKVTRWFVQTLHLLRVSAFVQSLVPFWRARRAEEAKLAREMRVATRTSWVKKMVQSSLARIKEMLTRPLRHRVL